MVKLKLAPIALVCLTAACSSLEDRGKARGEFDYLEVKEESALNIPESLQAPEYKKEYQVPQDRAQSAVGDSVDVRPPALVHTIARGSRVVEASQHADVWFDKVVDDTPLDLQVGNAIATVSETLGGQYAGSKGQWQAKIGNSDVTDVVFWPELQESDVQAEFTFSFDMKSHGRSGKLSTRLAKLTLDGEDALAKVKVRDIETAMLNQLISAYGTQVHAQMRNVKKRGFEKTEIEVVMGKDSVGRTAIVIDDEFDRIWANMPILFDKYGVDVDDRNRTKGYYYIKYEKPDNGLWDSLWGDEVPELNLDEGTYQFALLDLNGKTTIAVLNEEQKSIADEKITRLFEQLKKELSFER